MASIPPPRKRLRRDVETNENQNSAPSQLNPSSSFHLYAPFRALGLVTNHVPFAVQTRTNKGSTAPPRIHIVTCLGKSWMMWEGEKMTLLFVGSDLEYSITSLLMDGDAVWASGGYYITKFLRGKPVARLENPLETTIASILVFGSRMLALTEDGTHLLVWDMETSKPVNSIEFDADFTATHMLHPATYLNKILIGSSQGGLQLWNIATGMKIHTFDPSNIRSRGTSGPSAITSVVQSPAIDIVGIGFASGEVSIYDIRADERLLSVNMSTGVGSGGDPGRITAIGFRSDGEPILSTASSNGHIAFWDLNANARLLHVYRGAHDGSVTSMQWIPGQALLITSGDDNSVKQWVFDSPSEPPRLLKFRAGHQAPPHLIRYYGSDGKQLLTAARDRSLRYTSVVRDSRSHELSQGSLGKKSSSLSVPLAHFKLPPVTSLSFSSTRSKDWEDVMTSHSPLGSDLPTSGGAASSFARTWTVQNKRLGRWSMGLSAPGVDSRGNPSSAPPLTKKDDPASVLSTKSKKKLHTNPDGGVVRSVFVTSCGNFGLAGSSKGKVVMWNMQSGIRRREFDVGPLDARMRPATLATNGKGKSKAVERPITGVAVDPLNRTLVATTLDGTVNFFDFHSAKRETIIQLPSAAVSLLLQPHSGLLAIICDDMAIRMVDIETRRVVREYIGFKGRILDITFSPDSRWLVASSMDGVIRTFDIPTGTLIDAFKTPSVCTSLSFSPTGDFLATSHVDSVGVYLWANRAQYAEVSLQSFDESAALARKSAVIQLPSLQGTGEDEALDSLTALSLDQNDASVYTTPDQLSDDLVTLTLLPRSKWQTLLNLETIAQRNKPKEAPKAPEKAPFFLPTLPGVDHRFDIDSGKKTNGDPSSEGKQRRVAFAGGAETEFQRRLLDEDLGGDYESFFVYLKALSPAAIDLELRSLSSDAGGPNSYLSTFLHSLSGRLKTHKDFEAVQTFLAVFLRLHGSILIESDGEDPGTEDVRTALEELLEVQRTESERILDLVSSSLGTLSFVRDVS
ncbi:Utp21-domain-containing protein [Clavulina sp. PMI_390]|nr:Utp21-domain-containing protein [Clavulina sp. PMI_390]